MLQQTAGVFI